MNETLSNIEGYHYLISSLEDEPRQLLQNLPITNDKFKVARELIYNRYDNKKIICAKHAKALLNLHSAYSGAAQDYRRLINEVSSNIAAIEGLNTGVSLHEIILMEAILNNIKAHDRQDWEVRTASSHFPKLQNLIDFLENKCQAFKVIDFEKISVANK
jgi:hypothetical protein